MWPAHDQVEGWNCSLYFPKTILGSGLFWSCSLQINTGTFPTAFGSVDLEHLNLALCYQGAFTTLSSPLFACCSENMVLCFLPCLGPLSFCVWVSPPLTDACWAGPPGSCVLQGEVRGPQHWCPSSCLRLAPGRQLFYWGAVKNPFSHILPFMIQYKPLDPLYCTFAQPTLTQK